MNDDKYRPRSFAELEADPIPVSLLNEPLPPDNVATLAPRRAILITLLQIVKTGAHPSPSSS
jgi:hypothetical protein